MQTNDLLIELLIEELPARSLQPLAAALLDAITAQLAQAQFPFKSIQSFVTPRRLAILVTELAQKQPDQIIEKKGPHIKAAFDGEGHPTKAALGFAKSAGVEVDALIRIHDQKNEWIGVKEHRVGQDIESLIGGWLQEIIPNLPMSRKMRWGSNSWQFLRPWHNLLLLYGGKVIDATFFDLQSTRVTKPHRFMRDGVVTVPQASLYESLLETEGGVMVDFEKRKQKIKATAEKMVHDLRKGARLVMDNALLDEVTGLVEWPNVLLGAFDSQFLKLPSAILTSAMKVHQRYFPIFDEKQNLLPYFIIVSNTAPSNPKNIIKGNERVLRARLADADFFYQNDQKIILASRLEQLKTILYQAKLGTLYDKAERLSKLTGHIAKALGISYEDATRAGLLAKTDLTTDMVNEFPELQGVIGGDYAMRQEKKAVATAIAEQYLPRFSGDELPKSLLGQALALADRIDLLIGIFGLSYQPSGDKDPFGLRRGALAALRILIEGKHPIDLKELLHFSLTLYDVNLPNKNVEQDVLKFMMERLKAWYGEQAISADTFAAVSALNLSVPYDFNKRVKAVQAFKKLKDAESLSIANKRVSNILEKYGEDILATNIDETKFEDDAEKLLAMMLKDKKKKLEALRKLGQYEEALRSLAEMRLPIDNFFDHVMVMTEDKGIRDNRLLLLQELRALFLKVADIALLQQ